MPSTYELSNAAWRTSSHSGGSGQCVEVTEVRADDESAQRRDGRRSTAGDSSVHPHPPW
ncbi:DUF397 domain-containing protein [Actinoallomurus sp. NPDC052308]|uniref:DUF397 domain-containing protein n=1 Tax=Actinoallomurus sp. NPDC052308 TaxID=3155530 RepID=UPI003431CC48